MYEPMRYKYRLAVVGCLLLLGLVAMPCDLALSAFLSNGPLPGEFDSFVHKAEVFGHGYGVLGIAFTIYLVEESRRKQLPRLLMATLFAGLACNLLKLVALRLRPSYLTFEPGEISFVGLSFLHAESWQQVFDSAYQSFPSAHTATAVAFAVGLGRMYPKAAAWFMSLSVFVAASRMVGMSHYLSDTLVGGALGYAYGCWVWGDSKVGRWFTEWEARGTTKVKNGGYDWSGLVNWSFDSPIVESVPQKADYAEERVSEVLA